MNKQRLLNKKYLVIDKIGEGSYGQILCVIDLPSYKSDPNSDWTQYLYALKRQKTTVSFINSLQKKEGVNFTTLREIGILKEIKHD